MRNAHRNICDSEWGWRGNGRIIELPFHIRPAVPNRTDELRIKPVQVPFVICRIAGGAFNDARRTEVTGPGGRCDELAIREWKVDRERRGTRRNGYRYGIVRGIDTFPSAVRAVEEDARTAGIGKCEKYDINAKGNGC